MEMVKKYKSWVIRVIVGILLILGIRWYVSRDNLKPVSVREIEIERREVAKTVSASGELISDNEAILSFNAVGRIRDLPVKKGDKIEKGQYLGALDTSAVSSSTKALKDAWDIAKRDRELFVENYETNKEGYGGADEYDIKLRQYDEYVSKAEATYYATFNTLNNSYIYSPFEGYIIDVFKDVGETALAGESVVKVADLENMTFEIVLDQEDFGLVEEGMTVELNFDSFDDEEFDGVITLMPLYANGGGSNNFTVDIAYYPKEGYRPLLGMTGDAHIEIEKSDGEVTTLVYDEIFFDDEDESYIWIVENGYLKKLPIEIGLEGDIYTEVLTDLTGRQIVVPVDDTQDVQEGYKPKFAR